MSFANRHNKGTNWNIDTTDFGFTTLEELYLRDGAGVHYVLRGAYINTKGNYGDAPVFILDDCLVNMPSFMTDEVYDMIHEEDDVNEIIAGRVAFKIRTYKKTINRTEKTCYAITWVDVD